MPLTISQRTATGGTAASNAAFTITLPTGTQVFDLVILAVANAGTTGPAAPTGWTSIGTTSAGSGQSITIFWANYSPALTLNFTNAASACAFNCNSYTGGYKIKPIDASAATSNTGNNTTLPTGAPTTGRAFGDYAVLCYAWASAATIATTAAGSTISRTQANGTAVSCAIGFNNTTSLAANTTTTAFSQTLSANNNRKTGVQVLLRSRVPNIVGVGHPFSY